VLVGRSRSNAGSSSDGWLVGWLAGCWQGDGGSVTRGATTARYRVVVVILAVAAATVVVVVVVTAVGNRQTSRQPSRQEGGWPELAGKCRQRGGWSRGVEFVVARGVLVYYARSDFRPERAIPSRAAERGEKTRKRNHATRRGVRRDLPLSLSLSLARAFRHLDPRLPNPSCASKSLHVTDTYPFYRVTVLRLQP